MLYEDDERRHRAHLFLFFEKKKKKTPICYRRVVGQIDLRETRR